GARFPSQGKRGGMTCHGSNLIHAIIFESYFYSTAPRTLPSFRSLGTASARRLPGLPGSGQLGGFHLEELHARWHGRRERDAHADRSALTAHQPVTTECIFHQERGSG